jgi:non-ribosomal peptide synthetase component E (peptide arylation enzyme)
MDRIRFPIAGVAYHSAEDSAGYIDSGAWVWSTFGDALRAAAREQADKIYIAADDGSLTFAQLDAASESVAGCLLEIGLVPGDRAIFQVGTVKELVVALFGCFKAGVLPVCTLPQYREIEIVQLSALSGAKVYFVQADFSPAFDLAAFARKMVRDSTSLETLIVVRGPAQNGEHALDDLMTRYAGEAARTRTQNADPLPGDVAMLLLSGGSTGVPKIIPRMHAEYLGSCASWNARHRVGQNDVCLWALPLIHNAGMILMLLPCLLARRTLVIQSRFQIDDFLRAIERHRVTYTGSIGPIAPSIIACNNLADYDLTSLRMFFALAGAEGVEKKTGVESQHMYGITEGMLMTSEPGDGIEARHGTLGWPAGIADEVRVIEIGGDRNVTPGQTGELCFRGAHTLRGYFNAPDITAESFTVDGFFRTGDLVRAVHIGGRDRYFFEGRLKDNINRGGEKFGAEEVERLIVRHPAINDARVVAMPDPLLGEKACAFIIAKAGAKTPGVVELGEFLLAQGLAKFKLPERVEEIAELPVTRVGKVDKQALRKAIAEKMAAERRETAAG